jgi:hypothetical protein
MKANPVSVLKFLLPAAVAAVLAASPLTSGAAEQFKVSYRLEKWKTSEFANAEEAQKVFETFQKLGCETAQEGHGGHIDVRYRCPKWKEITVNDHGGAHRWEAWLKQAGFETRHAH